MPTHHYCMPKCITHYASTPVLCCVSGDVCHGINVRFSCTVMDVSQVDWDEFSNYMLLESQGAASIRDLETSVSFGRPGESRSADELNVFCHDTFNQSVLNNHVVLSAFQLSERHKASAALNNYNRILCVMCCQMTVVCGRSWATATSSPTLSTSPCPTARTAT